MPQVEIADEQSCLTANPALLRAGIEAVFSDAQIERAEISLAIVDDERIREVHRQFLQEDSPTDVISFVLERSADGLEGEIVASAETALAQAERWNWPADHELLLYVVHGVLHLVGYDDLTPEAAREMRQAERRTFARLGIALPPGYGDSLGGESLPGETVHGQA